jgi:hypothetical protein
MKTRRDFVQLMISGAVGVGLARAGDRPQMPPVFSAAKASPDDRASWIRRAEQLAGPVLTALAERKLKTTMPVEAQAGVKDRATVTHLEAFGRLLAGLSPWLELGPDETREGKQRMHWATLARAGIDAATDPASPDFMNFTTGSQPLVDAAFLAQALRRAPTELWKKLEPRVQRNAIAALRASRVIQPGESNWKLFATTIEVFFHAIGEPRDEARLFEGLRKHRNWYLGDGIYGDGAEFHWDYYNSFVIQPMLLEALDVVGGEAAEWKVFHEEAKERFKRYATIQERLIAPDGTFPVIGRSIAYRCGAFQVLAMAAWRRLLPAEVAPAQARAALSRVIERTLGVADTFDARGWLRIGLAGHQPALGERYISTGSLYLCSVALLPLGLPPTDEFWNAPSAPTSWEKIWAGENIAADHALKTSA